MSVKKNKTVEETYVKLSQREHILQRPDSYVGSLELEEKTLPVFNFETEKICEKTIWYSPAFYKIYDEVLVNAADHSKNCPECNKVDISIDRETNRITVRNNGEGIVVLKHKEHDVYVPTLVFGHLLSGSNFNDNEKRTTGGRNGYGAKLCNIFSKEFVVETFDEKNMKKFVQVFRNNMEITEEPKITTLKKGSGYTQISFIPDLERFGLTEITDDIYSLFVKRAYDLAGVCNKITVTVDGTKIKYTNFKQFIGSFEIVPESERNSIIPFSDVIYFEQENWQVGIIYTPDQSYRQFSYVNSICTPNGGNHVNHVLDSIIDVVKAAVMKKDKNIKLKPQTVKDNLTIFINSTIVNPSFDTQTKNTLNTPIKSFGSKCEIPEKFIKSFLNTGIVDYVLDVILQKDQAKIGKQTKKSGKSLSDLLKLEDAKKAGTKESELCTLILTEGDSAKALAITGLSVVKNIDYYGVFPLKGKLMNVRENSPAAILKNEEIKALCRIIGLTPGTPSDKKSRRYGRIVIMSDQDTDGFHINGLFINFLHFYWPELLELDNFIARFNTPIVKARKGKQEIAFFNMNDFLEWKETVSINSWTVKYYKGLGTSTNNEAKEYFNNLDKLIKNFVPVKIDDEEEANKHDTEILNSKRKAKKVVKKKSEDDDEEEGDTDNESETVTEITKKYLNPNTEAITLAFEKERVTDRKVWVKTPVLSSIDYDLSTITIPDFINKELKLFSKDDCDRNIPGLDGFKTCQRKILHTLLRNKIFTDKSELKVVQLGGKVSEETDYHHGEKSLADAIFGMARNYVGSNNVNLLEPSGQFGSRLLNGKDHASERYAYTRASKLTQFLFKQEDFPVLKYNLNENGQEIEPTLFAPILPFLLFNGSSGIGTGYSSDWTCYNPQEIIDIFKAYLTEEEANHDILPFFRGFNGSVLKSNEPGKYLVYGKYQILNESQIKITEIPVGNKAKSYFAYKEFLDDLKKKNDKIIDISSELKQVQPYFIVTMDEDYLENLKEKKLIYKTFKLINPISTRNMHLFNVNNELVKYNTIEEYLSDFYYFRYEIYEKRKEYSIKNLSREVDILKWKVQFIDHYLDGTIEIANKKKVEIYTILEELSYPKFGSKLKADDEDDEESENYNYLLSMKLWNLSEEYIQKLRKELKDRNKELKVIETTTIEDQWLKEICDFENAYNEFLTQIPEEKEIIDGSTITEKKSRKKKSKKTV